MNTMYRYTFIPFLLVIILSGGCADKPSGSTSINGSFFNIDTLSRGSDLPLLTDWQTWTSSAWRGSAWRGERISSQLLLWAYESKMEIHVSASSLTGEGDDLIPANRISLYRIASVISDEFGGGCEKTGILNYDSSLVADVLEPIKTSLELEVRVPLLLWITMDIPSDAVPGVYKGKITIAEGRKKGEEFQFEVEVMSPELTPPSAWGFHLDLWQNPFSVARFFNVEPWSDEHFDRMRPTIEMLADAGQKCITTTLTAKPWGGQTFDPFESMVKKTRKAGGSWTYDYSVFDAWVVFAMECGIEQQINCYSMVSWNNEYNYFDEAKGKEIMVSCKPGSSEYNEIWIPFLNNFNEHLLQKNWHDRTAIAMDERSMEDLLEVIKLIDNEAPGLKIAFAGRYHPELDGVLYDLSVASKHIVPKENLSQRDALGFKTTFYVCCVEEQPNTFSFSKPAEATYLSWYAANRNFDGMLRWSYNSWTENPLHDSRFRRFPAGDTYMVYPGGVSSVRFERLREGIQDFEKINILRSEWLAEASLESEEKLKLLSSELAKFDILGLSATPASETVAQGRQLLHQLSK